LAFIYPIEIIHFTWPTIFSFKLFCRYADYNVDRNWRSVSYTDYRPTRRAARRPEPFALLQKRRHQRLVLFDVRLLLSRPARRHVFFLTPKMPIKVIKLGFFQVLENVAYIIFKLSDFMINFTIKKIGFSSLSSHVYFHEKNLR